MQYIRVSQNVQVHTVHTVKSAVSLKWQVGFENDMKITPIFTIIFSSKILTRQCFTSLEHTFYQWPEFT